MKRNILLFGGAIFGVIAGSTLMRMVLSGFNSGVIIYFTRNWKYYRIAADVLLGILATTAIAAAW